jgi:hypothetical protein
MAEKAKPKGGGCGGCLGLVAFAAVIVIVAAAIGHSASSSSSVQQSGATVPASCGALSEDYKSLGQIAGSFSSLAESFIKLIPQAAVAGEHGNAEAIASVTTKLEEGTTQIGHETTEVEMLNAKEATDAEGCK